jgi:cytochrome c oxidase cbb3-type subunit 3
LYAARKQIGLDESGVTRMKRFRDLAILAAIAALAAYQGRQLHIYAASGQTPATPTTQNAASPTDAPAVIAAGGSLFQQNCAFCHGRDAGGGETGPDLTRSKLVTADVGGDKIGDVVLHGRPDKGMPAFSFSSEQVAGLAAFIHAQQNKAMAQSGKRKGVDVSDLQTGNVEAGKAYFNGAGGCATCHSPTGDLAGIASRFEGLQLEERMLYPRDVKSKVTVTLPSGEKVAGTLAYLDEFTVGLRDEAGTYRSWRVSDVKYAVDSPVEAHVALFSKYTDDDIHNLMAYLQTLR